MLTFRPLQRLETRDLGDCSVEAVPVDDWMGVRLVDHARESIEDTGEQIDDAKMFRSGSWGPPGADRLTNGFGGWYGPGIAS